LSKDHTEVDRFLGVRLKKRDGAFSVAPARTLPF
jgi:hypothetical protein